MPSAKEQARKLIEDAATMIQAGNPQLALENLRQSILYNGKDPEAYILLGVSLAQVKRPVDAENAFIKATKLDPTSAKAFYNLAVLMYAEGRPRKAYEVVLKGLDAMPAHAASIELKDKLVRELGDKAVEDVKARVRPQKAPEPVREGYQEENVEAMPFIRDMGKLWTVMGVGLVILSFLGFLLAVLTLYPSVSGGNFNRTTIEDLQRTPGFSVLQVTFVVTTISALAWQILDLLHRRGHMMWIIPQAFCGCIGFAWVILPLYMVFGRNKD